VETKQRCNAPGDSAVAWATNAWRGPPALQSSSSGFRVAASADVLDVVFYRARTRAVTRVPAALFEALVCWATLALVCRVHQLKLKQPSNIALAGVIRCDRRGVVRVQQEPCHPSCREISRSPCDKEVTRTLFQTIAALLPTHHANVNEFFLI